MRHEWMSSAGNVIVRDEQDIGGALEYRLETPDSRTGHTEIFLREILRLAAESASLREERDAARLAHEASEGTLAVAVARLGGLVEGHPTARINFLQRIDELRRTEAGAAALAAENLRLQIELENARAVAEERK